MGLTQLQKGNREGVIRVRARDAADFVAQHVLDSIAAVGVKALDDNCENSPDNLLPEQHDKYIYYFEGKPQLDKKSAGIKAETQYTVKVRCIGEDIVSEDKSDFITANSTISRSIEAEVTWKFKGIDQSIRMSKVVR